MEVGGAHTKVGGAYAVTCSREGLALGIVLYGGGTVRDVVDRAGQCSRCSGRGHTPS